MLKQILNSILLIASFITLLGCSNPPPAEDSCNFVQNSFNRRVSWVRFPIRFYADDSITDDMYRGIVSAMNVWNEEFNQPVFELIGRTHDLPTPSLSGQGQVVPDAFNGIYMVSKETFENTATKDEQARTSISFRGDYIYESDILIDGSEEFYFEDAAIQSNSGKVQFKSLMVHELGHVLGLGHIDEPSLNSVMNSRLQYGQLRTELSEVDRSSLSCEY